MGPGDRVILDQLKELLQVEPRHRDDGGTVAQGRVHDHEQPVDMEERQHSDQPVFLPGVMYGSRLADVCHQVAVGEHHALGEPGRAARVRKGDQIVGRVDVDLRRPVATLQQGGERRRPGGLSQDEQLFDPGPAGGIGGAVHERRNGEKISRS